MKKKLALALAALLALPLAMPATVNAATNGELMEKDGIIFVPVRKYSEKYGLHIKYDEATHTAYILDDADATPVAAEKGETMNLYRNDQKLNTTIIINEENRSFIPASDFADAVGLYYYEDTTEKTVYMFDEEVPLMDGEYVAVGEESRGWTPKLTLTVKDGKIESVVFNEYNAEGKIKREDENYLSNWQAAYPDVYMPEKVDMLQGQLVERQDPNAVDVTTGATSTYKNFVKLSKNAMAQAKAAGLNITIEDTEINEVEEKVEETVETPATGNFTDGVYRGKGKGFAGDIEVEVKVENGKIVSVDVLQISDTPGIGDKGAEEVSQKIVENQSTDVDVRSGATVSSKGTMEAVKNALDSGHQAVEEPQEEVEEVQEVQEEVTTDGYKDGVYTGQAKGFAGDIEVEVKVENGKIVSVDILKISDTPGIGDKGAEEVSGKIVESQSADVDVRSGATVSSKATMEAVKDALSKAK